MNIPRGRPPGSRYKRLNENLVLRVRRMLGENPEATAAEVAAAIGVGERMARQYIAASAEVTSPTTQ